MDKLRFLDASFLYLETPDTPMNIASVQMLALPAGTSATSFCQAQAQHIEARLGHLPVLTKRLLETPLGMDHPVWIEAANFDLNRHLQQRTLQAPGNRWQLEDLVARLHEQPLPRDQPLWQFTLIDGLGPDHCNDCDNPSNTAVLYCKYHHACIDGMAGQSIIDVLFSTDPARPTATRPRQPAKTKAPGTLELLRDAGRTLWQQSSGAGSNLAERLQAAQRLGGRWWRGQGELGALGDGVPKTPFNTSASPYRTWAMASLPLQDIRNLGKTQGASINDMVMAICALAVRRYLLRHHALPAQPLRCGVPVSLRSADDPGMNNQVTMLMASMDTSSDDPLVCLAALQASMATGLAVTRDTQTLTSGDLHLPGLATALQAMVRLYGATGLAAMLPPVVNLVVSNVKGPRRPMYLCGARMLTHYPVSIASHGATMNITVQSYCERIDFGITACLEAVPDVRSLRDDLTAAWQDLRAAVLAANSPGPGSRSEISAGATSEAQAGNTAAAAAAPGMGPAYSLAAEWGAQRAAQG
nr:putative wax ester synthase/acyl-CoA:diacylglycerol acyltransferase [uncultured bacterium]